MEKEIYIINRLLEHDLKKFAFKIGAIKNPPHLKTSEAVEALNIAEKLSRDYLNEDAKQRCLLICALIWEHKNSEWDALPSYLTRLLARIGLIPVTKMLSKDESFESTGSVIDDLYFSSNLHKAEVSLTEGKNLILSNFQKKLWDSIDKYNFLGVSAPTSAGKSYILVNKVIQSLLNENRNFLFVVPTISLINQLSNDFRKALKNFSIDDCDIHHFIPIESNDFLSKNIYILTQERLMSGINSNSINLNDLDIAIFDEIQNIERAHLEEDERAKRLHESILTLLHDFKPKKMIISGPRINNISDLTKKLFGENSISITTELPPVLNMTYSFSYFEKKLKLKQYNYVVNDVHELELENTFIKQNLFGKQNYNKNIIELVNNLINNLNSDQSGTIIFSPTSKQSSKIAKLLTEEKSNIEKNESVDSLSDYISETIHPNYELVTTVKKGVGYHHGKMPLHLRNVIEIAFKEFNIRNLVCTTTLIQGVNLPAKNIITRNPNLYTKRSNNHINPTLTGYEFGNLRGRAGRLMQDFLGRTIILDEEMFLEKSINPAVNPTRTIEPSYQTRFKRNEKKLNSILINNLEVEKSIPDKDIIIYIRQMVIKYGEESDEILQKVGIFLTPSVLNSVKDSMSRLSLDIHTLASNRYWDPLTLTRLHELNLRNRFPNIPTTPFDKEYVRKIFECLIFLEKHCPIQFYKYFKTSPLTNRTFFYRLIVKAQSWSQGKSLNEIISWKQEITNEDIETTLDDVNKYVQYNLPTILKPLIDINGEENNILYFMETGVFSLFERELIELGLNRELAIRVTKQLKTPTFKKNLSGPTRKTELKQFLIKNKSVLNYWDRKQIDLII